MQTLAPAKAAAGEVLTVGDQTPVKLTGEQGDGIRSGLVA